MLKKEFNEVSKQSLFFIALVIGIPVLGLILAMLFKWSLTYNEIFFPVYQVGIFIFAVVTGLTLFSAEKRQGGMEYLLTLPLSRMRLLGLKVLPRFVALCVLLLFYSLYMNIMTGGGTGAESIPILPTFYLAYIAFGVFIISVSISAFHDNIILLAFGVLIIVIAHFLLLTHLQDAVWKLFGVYPDVNLISFAVLSIIGLLVPFAAAFVLAFRKFDIHPAGRFNRKYLKVFVPLLVICLAISAIFAYSIGVSGYGYKFYYLAANHKVIESDWNSARIYEKGSGKIVPLDISSYIELSNAPESGGYVYAETYSRNPRQFIRINVTDNTMADIYTTKGYYSISERGYWLYKNIFALFEGNLNSGNRALVLVNIDTMAVNKIKLPAQLQEKYRVMRVFGVDESSGRRSWLVYGEKGLKSPVYRIWEDGTCMELAIRGHSPYYINGMVISREESGMVFSRLTEAGCEEIKIDPRGKSVALYPLVRLDLNNAASASAATSTCKEVYGVYTGNNGKSLMKVDLEKLEVTKLRDFQGTLIYYSPEQCYLLENFPTVGKFYRILGNGQLELLRTFSGFNARKKGNFLRLCRNGIIARENGKISVYEFPGLQELSFKGLK